MAISCCLSIPARSTTGRFTISVSSQSPNTTHTPTATRPTTVSDETAAEAMAHLRADDAIAPLVDRYGRLTLDPADDPFARLIESICSQQVSSAAARSIHDGLSEAIEMTPEGVLAADRETLRAAGLSGQKVRYVRAAAERFHEDGWDRATFEADSNETVRDRLTAIPGVGPWTADTFLLFALGRPDVYPVGDLAVRRATAARTGVDPDDRTGLRERAERWSPYRSYAALYLWHDYEDGDTDAGRR